MEAVVFHGIGAIHLDKVAAPKINDPNDAIVHITASATCGTDLHFIRGTFYGMKRGRILGHEARGLVEEVGKAVRNFRPGDRVYPPTLKSFPSGMIMNKNLTVRAGNCHHRKYLPRLVELVPSGVMHPEQCFSEKVTERAFYA